MRKFLSGLLFVLLCFSFAGAISYEDFYSVFVDLPGWEASEPTGSKVTIPVGTMVQAERSYTKGDKSFIARVVTGYPAMSFVQMSSQFEYESPEGFLKNATVKGLPAKVSYQIKERGGMIIVTLTRGNTPRPAVMVFEFENMDYREALSLANKFPVGRAVRLARQP